MNNKAEKFKETEIGFIPKEWTFEVLEKHADILMGQSPESVFYNNSGDGLSFLQGIRTFSDKYPTYDTYTTKITKLAKQGSVLLSVRAPVGEVNIADRDICIGRGLVAINSENNEFIFQLFKAFKKYVVGKETGTVYGSITKDDVAKLEFPFPSRNEQTQIAEILSSLDDKIELNRKINDNLEKIASSLFKRWFVDFEFPDKNGKPYKSSGGRMVESEIGNIPDNWRVGIISDLISIDSGFSFSSSIFDENGKYGLITIKNVQDGDFLRQCSNYIKNLPDKMPGYCKLKNGDILLSLTGNVGRICIVNGENYLLNQRVAALNPIKEMNRAFTYFLFRQKYFQDLLINISRGTAQQNLSPVETKNLEIIIPQNNTLKLFSEACNNIFLKIVNNLIEINNLSDLRDSLLPKLMSGKIRVK